MAFASRVEWLTAVSADDLQCYASVNDPDWPEYANIYPSNAQPGDRVMIKGVLSMLLCQHDAFLDFRVTLAAVAD